MARLGVYASGTMGELTEGGQARSGGNRMNRRERTWKKHQGRGKVGEKARPILWLRSLSEFIFLCSGYIEKQVKLAH